MHPSQIPPLREPLCRVHQVGLAPDCTGKDGKSIREPGDRDEGERVSTGSRRRTRRDQRSVTSDL
jgi:hypothetical protein